MQRWILSAGLVLGAACATGTEPALQVSGTVRSANSGLPVAGAEVALIFRAAFASTTTRLAAATSGGDGRFSLEIGPPPGYSYPNCATLHLEVRAAGHAANTFVPIGGAESPGCRAGAVEISVSLLPDGG